MPIPATPAKRHALVARAQRLKSKRFTRGSTAAAARDTVAAAIMRSHPGIDPNRAYAIATWQVKRRRA